MRFRSRFDVRAVMWIALAVAGLSTLAFAWKAPTKDRVVSPKGDLREATLADLRPNMDVHNEEWAYRVFLDNDIQVAVDLRRVDLGSVKGRVLGANLSVIGFGGENYAVEREYPTELLSYSEESNRLKVHRNIWFEGDLATRHHLHYETTKKGTSYYVDLEFTAIETGYVWGDGEFGFGKDDRITIAINIPSSRVSGRVAINGDTLRVQGTGYLDHVHQSRKLSDLIRSGYRYVSTDSSWSVGLFITPKANYDAPVAGYALRKQGAGAALFRPSAIDVHESKVGGKRVAQRIHLASNLGDTLTIERVRNRQQLDLLRHLGGLKRFLVKRFAGGDITVFRGTGTVDGDQPMYYDFFLLD